MAQRKFFDHEKQNSKFFKNSGDQPGQCLRHRNGKIFPIPPALEVSAERLKLAKQTQIIFQTRRYI